MLNNHAIISPVLFQIIHVGFLDSQLMLFISCIKLYTYNDLSFVDSQLPCYIYVFAPNLHFASLYQFVKLSSIPARFYFEKTALTTTLCFSK